MPENCCALVAVPAGSGLIGMVLRPRRAATGRADLRAVLKSEILESQEGPGGMDIGIVGCAGRMGRMLIGEVLDSEGCRLAGAIERPGSDAVGRDAASLVGREPVGVPVGDDPLPLFATAQAVIDFTSPDATADFAELAAQGKVVHVIGTTGLGPDHEAAIARAARHAPIIRAANMSLGVNLLVELVRQVAAALDERFDIEIAEMHHRHKKDAPSGTALALGQAAAEGRQVALEEAAVRGRDGLTGERAPGAIGFAALRGGDVVGEHTVVFAGPGERVELTHKAADRAIFARGAVRAALWGYGKPPGLYGMREVLGL
jgi:4-hydroxy-tetrahydrodipicolinate reductase